MAKIEGDEVYTYLCGKCGARGYSRVYGCEPDGWSGSICPNCVAREFAQRDAERNAEEAERKAARAKEEAKRTEKEAERKAKKQAAREAQAAYDATPDGKKERNIAALSAVAAVLLFFLFACVFHLWFVAFIVGFIAGAPFFWFRARKLGFLLLVLILLIIWMKIDDTDSKDDGNSVKKSETSEVVAPANSQTEMESKQTSAPKISNYLDGVDDISDRNELSRFYLDIASKFYNNEMGLKGTQEQIDAGNELMSTVYTFLGRAARNSANIDADGVREIIQNAPNISNFRKKKALEELQLGIDKISEMD